MHLQKNIPEYKIFRDTLKAFIQKEILPHIDEWERNGAIDKSIWKKMGEMGFMGLNFPAKYGGMELDFNFTSIFCEELSKCFSGGFTIAALVSQFMSTPYLEKFGSEELKEKFLKPCISGDALAAIAITEPYAGSDVASIKTTAVLDGDCYIINGSKTFITNGYYADFIITAVKTDPKKGKKGVSLLLIERESVGLTANKIEKLGWKASDTAELAFDQVRVPKTHLIGKENEGFKYLMAGLQLERLIASIHSLYTAISAFDYTMEYIQQREAFGKKLKEIQVLRHRIAQMDADISVLKSYLNHCVDLQYCNKYAVKECSIAKLQTSELALRTVNTCLQLFGGYGFTEDYKIARMYRDVRAGTIIGGTSEIMLEIISKMTIDQVDYKPN